MSATESIKCSNNCFFSLIETKIAEGKSVKFRVKGNSMYPFLRDGYDLVILEKCSTDSLKPMDVILFRYRGIYILHRIIKRDGVRLLIQGDGVISAIEQCTVDDVVGKVVKVCRSSGKTISVDSKRWILLSRLWRCSKIIRVLGLKLNSFRCYEWQLCCTKGTLCVYEEQLSLLRKMSSLIM